MFNLFTKFKWKEVTTKKKNILSKEKWVFSDLVKTNIKNQHGVGKWKFIHNVNTKGKIQLENKKATF